MSKALFSMSQDVPVRLLTREDVARALVADLENAERITQRKIEGKREAPVERVADALQLQNSMRERTSTAPTKQLSPRENSPQQNEKLRHNNAHLIREVTMSNTKRVLFSGLPKITRRGFLFSLLLLSQCLFITGFLLSYSDHSTNVTSAILKMTQANQLGTVITTLREGENYVPQLYSVKNIEELSKVQAELKTKAVDELIAANETPLGFGGIKYFWLIAVLLIPAGTLATIFLTATDNRERGEGRLGEMPGN
jgi:hypothetical protein